MPRRFYELSSDVQFPGRWYLGDPLERDPWQFTEGGPVRVEGHLEVPIYKHGRPLDFSLTGTGIPIVHARAASLFTELAPDDVQFLQQIGDECGKFGHRIEVALQCADVPHAPQVAAAEAPLRRRTRPGPPRRRCRASWCRGTWRS